MLDVRRLGLSAVNEARAIFSRPLGQLDREITHAGQGSIRVALKALGLSLIIPTVALAQTAPLPGSIDPGQLEKRFETPLTPRAAPIVVPDSKAPPASEDAARLRFQLGAITIEGASVFNPEELQTIYAEQLQKEISLQDIYQIAARITAHYGNAGYILSRAIVPPQSIEDGRVRLTVIEGYVNHVILEGDPGQRRELFGHYTERIKASRPLNAAVLERYLLLANDLPGLKLQSVLRPSPDNSGAAELILSASRNPWNASFSLDNRGSESSGPWQIVFEGNARDLLGQFENTTLRYATAPFDRKELNYWQLNHTQILNGEGSKIDLDFTASWSEPGGDTLRQLEIETRGQSLAATFNHPVIRARSRNLTLSAGLTARASETLQLGQIATTDRLYALRLGVIYDQADAWGGVNLLSATASKGLDVLDAVVGSRAHAAPSFSKFELQYIRSQTVNDKWNATLRMGGQLADGSLPASEQFGLGGENSVRGYTPSEWTGDRGLSAGLEVVWRPSIDWEGGLQVYSFYDHATLWRARPENEAKKQSAHALGFGMRTAFPNKINLALEAAKPLERHADGSAPNWRLYTRLTAQF